MPGSGGVRLRCCTNAAAPALIGTWTPHPCCRANAAPRNTHTPYQTPHARSCSDATHAQRMSPIHLKLRRPRPASPFGTHYPFLISSLLLKTSCAVSFYPIHMSCRRGCAAHRRWISHPPITPSCPSCILWCQCFCCRRTWPAATSPTGAPILTPTPPLPYPLIPTCLPAFPTRLSTIQMLLCFYSSLSPPPSHPQAAPGHVVSTAVVWVTPM